MGQSAQDIVLEEDSMIDIHFEPQFERAAAFDEAKLIGECDYHDAIHTWTIVHTEVNPEYGGQGIAKRLVECVLNQAKQKGIQVESKRSYASKVLAERNNDINL